MADWTLTNWTLSALTKLVNKVGLKDDYALEDVHCLMSLPLLPPSAIADAVSEGHAQLDADSQHASVLQQLIVYVNRQWINKRSIGPERMSVRDNRSRTSNVLEIFHAAL